MEKYKIVMYRFDFQHSNYHAWEKVKKQTNKKGKEKKNENYWKSWKGTENNRIKTDKFGHKNPEVLQKQILMPEL